MNNTTLYPEYPNYGFKINKSHNFVDVIDDTNKLGFKKCSKCGAYIKIDILKTKCTIKATKICKM